MVTFDYSLPVIGWCTLIRSILGIVMRDLVLDRDYFAKHLLHIPGMTAETAAGLIDLMDNQNVPKAIKLLQAIISLSNLPTADLNPTEQKTTQTLCLLGTML